MAEFEAQGGVRAAPDEETTTQIARDASRSIRSGGRHQARLAFTIDEVGCPRDVEIQSATTEAYGLAVARSVAQARFPVHTLGGEAVPVRFLFSAAGQRR
jgi:hypothetical protein